MTHFFDVLEQLNCFIWAYVSFILIIGMGLYFSIKSRFFQIRAFGAIFSSFFAFFKERPSATPHGVHPIKTFFAAIGGCIGIGNIVGICTAVQIGGPGALLWTWIGALCGMLIQYSEVFLGLRYRVRNQQGSYDGGPMYFLPRAYRHQWIAYIVCFLLCIYGVEIFMFNVIANSISTNWHLNRGVVVAGLLIATFFAASGGIKRVGDICSSIIPLFIVLYMAMAIYILGIHAEKIPYVLWQIVSSAFTPQAAVGAFAGSSVILTISMGLSRGAYSGDIGVGYTSVIYAEGNSTQIKRQSAMTIVGIFLDSFVICTLSILIILVTDFWHRDIDVTLIVQQALGLHIPYMHIFMPFFLFLLGYTTILAYFVVGVKCAKFISPKWGPWLYYGYASIALPLFAFVNAGQAFLVMSLAGAFLLLLNLIGIFLLRKEVEFGLEKTP